MKSPKMFSREVPFLGRALAFATFGLWAASVSAAQTVNLAWDPSPDSGVGFYRVHYGTTTGAYSLTTNSGTATSLTVSGLTEGVTYYFAVTAVGTNQLESDFSNEVSYSVPVANTPPTISAISNRSINEDANTGSIGFTVGDAETAAASLALTGSSSNTQLVPNANIAFSGTGANRTVTLTPAANAFGSAQITLSVSDGDLNASQTFTLTVNSVNDAPTLSPISDVNVAQDAGQQTVGLSGIGTGAANETQTLTVTASSSNPSLIPTPTVTYSSPSSTGTLRFTPAAGQSGSAQLTVTVADNGGTANGGINTFQRTFTVNVIVSANAAPTLDDISPLTVTQAEGETGLSLGALGAGTRIWAVSPAGPAQTTTVNLTGIGTGGESGQTLSVSASSSNPTLVPSPTVTYSSPASTGSLRITPAVGATGSAVITVTVRDNGGGTDTIQKTFPVTVNGPANTPPYLTRPADYTMYEDIPSGTIGIGLGDVQTVTDALILTAASRNPSLVANSGLILSGSGSSRSLRIQSQSNQSGKAMITLSASDADGAMVNRSFWVNVTPVNDAPTVDAVPDQQLSAGQVEVVTLSGIGPGPLEGVQSLTVQASSSNPSLIPAPEVVYYSPNATAELQLLAAGSSGSATITVTVKDDGGMPYGGTDTTTRTFTVTTSPQVAAVSAPLQVVESGSAAALVAPVQPVLRIRQEGSRVVLSWDGALGSYGLERTGESGLNGVWTRVNTEPQPAGGTMVQVELECGDSSEFFRLAWP